MTKLYVPVTSVVLTFRVMFVLLPTDLMPPVWMIPLMEIVQVLQEELHIPGLFGQNQAALLFRYRVAMHKLLERAVRNRIGLNIA